MATQGGHGLTIKINTGSLTEFANVISCEFTEQTKALYETMYHDSASAYTAWVDTGLRRLGPFTLVLAWDDTETTHAQVLTSFAATTAIGMSVADSLAQETIAFSAFPISVKRISESEEAYRAEIVFQPTGAPTIT